MIFKSNAEITNCGLCYLTELFLLVTRFGCFFSLPTPSAPATSTVTDIVRLQAAVSTSSIYPEHQCDYPTLSVTPFRLLSRYLRDDPVGAIINLRDSSAYSCFCSVVALIACVFSLGPSPCFTTCFTSSDTAEIAGNAQSNQFQDITVKSQQQ